ncbi:MAG: uroporphyrinogen decarboxylase family protein, partial [Candidatus Hecatellaceae archaeon]
MKAYDRVMEALRRGRSLLDRPPCINPTSTATIQLMEASGSWWPEAHWNPEKMARLASAAPKITGLENVSIPFDITVEAEVFGAPVNFMVEQARRGLMIWPKVSRFIVEKPEDLKIPLNVRAAGRIPRIVEAIRLLKREFEGEIPVNVFITPPFTTVAHLLVDPLKFFPMLVREPEKCKAILDMVAEVHVRIAEIYEEAGADLLTFHDMGATIGVISPSQFEEFAFPYLKRLVKAVRCPTILSICGSNLPIIKRMVEVGASAIAIDEKTPMADARRLVDEVKPGY